MKEIISPRILPTNFTAGKDIPSYEFYNPLVAARQLGFGQVPPLSSLLAKSNSEELSTALSLMIGWKIWSLVQIWHFWPIGRLHPLSPPLSFNGGQNVKSIDSIGLPAFTAPLWMKIIKQARTSYKPNYLPQCLLTSFACSFWLLLLAGRWSEPSNNQ